MKALLKSLLALLFVGAVIVNAAEYYQQKHDRATARQRARVETRTAAAPAPPPVPAVVPVDPCQGQVVCQRPDGTVQAVVDWLLDAGIRHPESYQGLAWSKLVISPSSGLWMVKHQYRALNDFGQLVTEQNTFALDIYGQVQHVF